MRNTKNYFRVLMGLSGVLVAISFCTGSFATPDSTATAPALALGRAFVAVIDDVKDSVVSVQSERMVPIRGVTSPRLAEPLDERSGDRQVPVVGLGAGFIIDQSGNIVTNYHVVSGMEKIRIIFPNKHAYEGVLVGFDAQTDIAIIRVSGGLTSEVAAKIFRPAVMGDSDATHEGDLVLAFGAPFGLMKTVTSGIIGAVGRSDVGISDFEDFLQTDAPINPGNSGGPLVDMEGKVIGINTAIVTSVGQSAGIGFAIPINSAKQILPELIQGKTIPRSILGVVAQDVLDSNDGMPGGALVLRVGPLSPADKAGIKRGDVITKIAGKNIDNAKRLHRLVALSAPGTRVEVELLRNGKVQKVMVSLSTEESTIFSAPAVSSALPENRSLLSQNGTPVTL